MQPEATTPINLNCQSFRSSIRMALYGFYNVEMALDDVDVLPPAHG
jgi:hypothetical protein